MITTVENTLQIQRRCLVDADPDYYYRSPAGGGGKKKQQQLDTKLIHSYLACRLRILSSCKTSKPEEKNRIDFLVHVK